MLIQIMFVLCSYMVTGRLSNDVGYCEIPEICKEQQLEKHLFYDVNPPEGFNLRRDVYMRFAIMFSEAQKKQQKLDWKLVLPPWHGLFHWKSDLPNSEPVPWNLYFDVDSLKSYAPLKELYEVFVSVKPDNLKLDRLYILQNYEGAFEDGVFREKWEINKEACYYDGDFWGYHNITVKEVVCIKFQGKASKLWEIISLHRDDKKVMFAHGEIALHDSYGSKEYWECRKSMKFSRELIEIAERYMENHFGCTKPRPDILDIALMRNVNLKLGCIETLQRFSSDHRPVLMRLRPTTDNRPRDTKITTNWKKVSTALEEIDTPALNKIPNGIKSTNDIDNGIALKGSAHTPLLHTSRIKEEVHQKVSLGPKDDLDPVTLDEVKGLVKKSQNQKSSGPQWKLTIFYMSPLSGTIDRKSKISLRNKRTLYTMCIKPVMTYACPIFAHADPTALQDLQVIQNKFCRRATGAQWYLKNSVLHRDLELPTLSKYMKDASERFFSITISHPNPLISATTKYKAAPENHFLRRPRNALVDPPDDFTLRLNN
ncbi:GDP-fucose protein O-fucosyltransferase 2 [Eumeta japonica]|uniref:GDP-fucose protein O-fucosyltransferase 2 n=1 Tax=Eumeta variegata TaxID=151549 RepID=A0A4C1WX64_EUMVA|nr:GDP-fucose protein O-fucosyltransferase 2 [Eumeta japonica]